MPNKLDEILNEVRKIKEMERYDRHIDFMRKKIENSKENFIREFTWKETSDIWKQIENKTFFGPLICGCCQKVINPYKEHFEFSGMPKFFGPDMSEKEIEEESQFKEEETFNPICKECHKKLWGC